ncbi:unnamed protein product [Orchesella dallaii]|uniref:C2H2-type domain-containing protein n=1 Tax=Orchesella dallaii TaxID=48710 RepID=A0ABP1PVF3_9HEXA
MVRSGSPDTPPVTGVPVSSKRECGICHKIFESRTYRDIHLEKQHGVLMNYYSSTDDELESSEDENDPAMEAIPAKEDGEGGQATLVERDNTIPKVVENEVAPETEAFRSSEDLGERQGTPVEGDKLIPEIVQNEDAPKPRVSESLSLPKPKQKCHQFLCNICKKSFGTSQTLKKHFMFHTGVRPFKCCFCEAAFPVKENLVQHLINMNIHKQERKTANAMANEAGLDYLKVVKERTAQELKNLPHSSIASAVVDYVIEDKGSQQIAKLRVQDDRTWHTKENGKRGKHFSCQLCPYQNPSKKIVENHGELHEAGSKAKVCGVCNWFVHERGMDVHKNRWHLDVNVTAPAAPTSKLV